MNKMTKKDLIIAILHTVLSVAVLVFALIYIFAQWEPAKNFYLPLMAVVMFLQAYRFSTISKKVAIFSAIVALFILIVFIVGIFVS